METKTLEKKLVKRCEIAGVGMNNGGPGLPGYLWYCPDCTYKPQCARAEELRDRCDALNLYSITDELTARLYRKGIRSVNEALRADEMWGFKPQEGK